MTGFRWTDSTGATVELGEARAIEAEAAALTAKIDRLFREVDMLTGNAKEQKRREIGRAAERLDQLKADADRWNGHVERCAGSLQGNAAGDGLSGEDIRESS